LRYIYLHILGIVVTFLYKGADTAKFSCSSSRLRS
jgi:hypothetical protein